MPGFKQEELTLSVENGSLTLEGERNFEEEQKDKNYHRVERAYGRFYRSFALPANIDVSKVAATLVDGVLNVELPKREEATRSWAGRWPSRSSRPSSSPTPKDLPASAMMQEPQARTNPPAEAVGRISS